MKVEITKTILEECENFSKSDKFANFLTNNLVHFESVLFIADSVLKAIKEAKKQLESED